MVHRCVVKCAFPFALLTSFFVVAPAHFVTNATHITPPPVSLRDRRDLAALNNQTYPYTHQRRFPMAICFGIIGMCFFIIYFTKHPATTTSMTAPAGQLESEVRLVVIYFLAFNNVYMTRNIDSNATTDTTRLLFICWKSLQTHTGFPVARHLFQLFHFHPQNR